MKTKTLSRASLLLSALALAFACNPTGGVPIEVTIAFERLGPRSFSTVSGWQIELTEARAIVGPLYAYAPADEFALGRLLSPSRAFAHSGHSALDGRTVRAELLDPWVLDALDPAANEAVQVGGFAGAIDALTLVLAEPSDAEGPTRGHSIWVAGRATRDGDEVTFEGGLSLDDPSLRRIDNIPIANGHLDEGTRLIIGVDVSAWLSEADFEKGTITPGSQPYRALYLGARSAASWSARTEEQ